MKKEYRDNLRYVESVILYIFRWGFLAIIVGTITGLLSAFFLWSLEWVTKQQLTYTWLIFFLPVAGVIVSWAYKRFGGASIGGNNLVLNRVGGGDTPVPIQLIPLALFGTLATHLFGGSAGREGTAVQMGGAVAEAVGKLVHVSKKDRELIMICGISAGFSSVFGTPIAGTIFALEVLELGIIRNEALFSSAIAAFIGNYVTSNTGIVHTRYSMGPIPQYSIELVAKVTLAAAIFGLVGLLFVFVTSKVKEMYTRFFPSTIRRAFVGGIVIIIFTLLVNTRVYGGLSLPLLAEAFKGNSGPFDFILKLFFTALTLGSGYQGGEVTPIFVVGSTLGSSLGHLMGISVAFLAALGYIGVFSGATNTPIACFIMGVELFGSAGAPYIFFVCIITFICSGKPSIYSAQRESSMKNLMYTQRLSGKKEKQKEQINL